MQIKAGKYYRTRDGRKVGPMAGNNEHFRWVEGKATGKDHEWCPNTGRHRAGYGMTSQDDLIAEWQDEPETGTLQELNVKPGDVVELMTGHYKGRICAVRRDMGVRFRMSDGTMNGYTCPVIHIFRIISRAGASEETAPRTWGEMTDAEKGAMLMAAHEGKLIEANDMDGFGWYVIDLNNVTPSTIVRIRPEPKRETVTLGGFQWNCEWYFKTQYDARKQWQITLDTLDGNPITGTFTNENGDTIKMEEL